MGHSLMRQGRSRMRSEGVDRRAQCRKAGKPAVRRRREDEERLHFLGLVSLLEEMPEMRHPHGPEPTREHS